MPQDREYFRMRSGDHKINLAGLLFQGGRPDLTIEEAIKKFGLNKVYEAALGTVLMEKHNSMLPFHFPPTVFVSYRRATTQIEQWTKRLIDYLRARGYDAKFDMENPVTDHMSIASFVSNLPHADMVVIVNTEEYATDKTRLWIREERHAAILAALDGHCDLLVLQCKDAPLADDWLAFFPTVRVDTGECCFDHLDKWFPPIPATTTAENRRINSLLAKVKVLMEKGDTEALRAILGCEHWLLASHRVKELFAELTPKGERSAAEQSLADSLRERYSGRRLKFAQFMAAHGNAALAMTSLRPHLRNDAEHGPEAHRIIGGILEGLGHYNAARNHYLAGMLQSRLYTKSISAAHAYGVAACSLKLFEGERAIDALTLAMTCDVVEASHVPLIEKISSAANRDRFAEAIWIIDHDIRHFPHVDSLHFSECGQTVLYVHCSACKAEFDVSRTHFHICACCGCSFAESAEIADPENVLNCPVCSHTDGIPLEMLLKGVASVCSLCGIGELGVARADVNDTNRKRFSILTAEDFFEKAKLH